MSKIKRKSKCKLLFDYLTLFFKVRSNFGGASDRGKARRSIGHCPPPLWPMCSLVEAKRAMRRVNNMTFGFDRDRNWLQLPFENASCVVTFSLPHRLSIPTMSKAVSSVAKLARMRIFALPLTSDASATGLHTYYHFQTPPPVKPKGEPSLLKKATDKVSSVWVSFGKAPEGGWKVQWLPTPSLKFIAEMTFLSSFS